MTIKYKIFGIPQNLEEFVDKAKSKGVSLVYVTEKFQEENPAWHNSRPVADLAHYVTIEAYKLRIFVCKDYRASIWSAFHSDNTEMWKELKEKRRKNCLEVAKRLKELGLEVRLKEYDLWGEKYYDPVHFVEEVENLVK